MGAATRERGRPGLAAGEPGMERRPVLTGRELDERWESLSRSWWGIDEWSERLDRQLQALELAIGDRREFVARFGELAELSARAARIRRQQDRVIREMDEILAASRSGRAARTPEADAALTGVSALIMRLHTEHAAPADPVGPGRIGG
jgi:3-oxoacyl-ACP reductase-like protein